MRSFRLPLTITGILACAAFLLSATNIKSQATFIHQVQKGETISLICIDYYGHYSGMMGEAVLRLNPGMKSINTIGVGQKLKLPKPLSEKKAEDKAVSLFEKKIAAAQGVVTYIEGSASIIPKSSASRSVLAPNTVVYPGDVIETGPKSRVEMIINREAVVRLDQNTRLVIDAYREKARQKGTTSLGFSLGTLWTKVKQFKDKVSRFQLELPTAIAGVHGTVYQTTVASDSSADVKVYAGEVAVKNRPSMEAEESRSFGPQEVPGPHEVSMDEWVQIVRSMQRIKIDSKGQPGEPEPFTKDSSDTWEKWNEERDQRIEQIFKDL